MHETHGKMQCNAVNIQECMDKMDNNSPNYGSKEWCSAEMGFRLLIPFSLKCLHQRRLELPLLKSSSTLR